jgi:hypothetical protein
VPDASAGIGERLLPINRTLGSTWFLVSTALCCGLTVAFTSWLAVESSDGVRALAALSGLGFGVAIMLLIAWVLDGRDPARADAASTAVSGAAEPAPPAWPTAAPAQMPTTATAGPPSLQAAVQTPLDLRLEEGRSLRDQLEPGAFDARVGAWIDSVRQTIEQDRPGVVGYFDALSTRGYADDVERLDAHLGRLATIIRDFI